MINPMLAGRFKAEVSASSMAMPAQRLGIISDILIPPEAEDVVSGHIGVEFFRRLFAFDPADAARIPGKSQLVKLIAFDAGEYVERADVPDIFRQIPELH